MATGRANRMARFDHSTYPENIAESPEALTRFTFPRQPAGDHLCLADYFAPVAHG